MIDGLKKEAEKLHHVIQDFLSYCRLADFSHRSLQALAIRLNEFTEFLKLQHIRSIQKVSYLNLVAFVRREPLDTARPSSCLCCKSFNYLILLSGLILGHPIKMPPLKA